MNTADLKGLRRTLVDKARGSSTALTAMLTEMVSVMDRHLGKLEQPAPRKQSVREFHRHVSRTINAAYGVTLPYR